MADETIEFESRGADKVAADFKKVGRSAKDAGDNIEDSGKKSDDAGKGMAKLAGTLAKVTAAYAVLKEVVIDGAREFAAQEAAIGRLERSFKSVGSNAGQFAQGLEVLRKRSTELGVSFQGQVDGLSQLVDQSGDAATAHKDLALAIDIASQENLDLAAAVEILRKARNGEVEELKNLDGINKDAAESLNKITSTSRRANTAIAQLAKTYAGAAEQNKGREEEIAGNVEAYKRIKAAIGDVALTLGDRTVGVTRQFLDFFGILKEEESTLDNTATAFENLAFSIKEVSWSDLYEFSARGGFAGALLGTGAEDIIEKMKELRKTVDSVKGLSAPTFQQQVDEPLPVPTDSPKKKKEKKPTGEKKDSGLKDAALAAADMVRIEREIEEERLAIAEEFADNRARIFAQAEQDKRNEWRKSQEEWAEHQDELTELAEKAERERKQNQAKAQKQAEEIQSAALQAGADIAGRAADEFIENEAAKAAIQGAIQVALSIASFAKGPAGVAQGIAHAAAAAQFGIAAAAAGKSVPGGKGKGKGASAGKAARDRQREDVGLLGEDARSGAQQPNQPLVININSSFPPSPEQAAALADAVARDSRRRT